MRSSSSSGSVASAASFAQVLVAPDQFAELRAPVADVIVADDLGAAEREQPADGLADDHAADMADVELLGGIGRAEVHDVALTGVEGGGAGFEVLGGVVGGDPGEEGGGLELEIDETGSGDADLETLAQGGGEGGEHGFGDGAGVQLAGLGVAEHAVGLKIAMARVGRAHLRREGGRLEAGGLGGGLQGGVELRGDVERDEHLLTQRAAATAAQALIFPGPWRCARRRSGCWWAILARQISRSGLARKLFRPAVVPQLFTSNPHEQQTHDSRPPIHQTELQLPD
jgi:hypothetical protein